MESVTVRRWVGAPPDEVWHHLLDVPRLVLEDHSLDLEDVVGDVRAGVPPVGAHATITRRHGVRVERLVLDVVDRAEARSVTATVRIGARRWLLTVTLDAMVGDRGCGTDVRFHAEPDPSAGGRRGPRSLTATQRGGSRVTELLDDLARQLDTVPHAPAGAHASPRQRMAAGR